ncbi:MAG: glycosyltransferase [Paludibacteraceae bacterium]|nr:glycosyltransferase [Paludibacteraceae bacterium]
MDRNVLIISSKDPEYSASLGLDIMRSLEYSGFSVDYLTKYSYKGYLNNIYAIEKYSKVQFLKNLISKFVGKRFVDFIITFIKKRGIVKYRSRVNDILFIYPDESKTFISSKKILEMCSHKKYDYIFTIFWQDMINTTLLKEVYDKIRVPIIIYAVDMAPMTGGCYYFGDCNRFQDGCGMCPGLNSNDCNDKSHENYLTKKKNYSSIECALIGNSWILKYAKACHLFDNSILKHCSIVVNDSLFIPIDMRQARSKLGIVDQEAFIILYRSSHLLRKGGIYFLKAINRLCELNVGKQIIVLTIGDSYVRDNINECINHIHLGFVNEETLRLAYQSANVFVNTSLDDAGPSMINQSILCGTPVVCFNNGVAIDVIINDSSGYKYDTRDYEGLCNGLYKILSMKDSDYEILRERTRKTAMSFNSYESFANCFKQITHCFDVK